MNDHQFSSPRTAGPALPGGGFRASLLLRHCDITTVVATGSGRGLVVLSPVLTPAMTPTTGPGSDDLERHGQRRRPPVADRMHVFAEDTGLTTHEADEPVTLVDDPARQAVLLGDALADLAYHHDQTLVAERDRTAGQHARLLRIRQALIDAHRDGHLPADLLADLLAAAGLAPYRPRLRVTFTLTGSYDVPGTVADLPDLPDVRRRLVDVTDIDDHLATTADLTVHVDDITPTDD